MTTATAHTYDIGIDVGGTFTDVVMIGSDGRVKVTKGPSTPKDQSVGAADAASRLGQPLSTLRSIVHGTTVATNAILERKGAVIALVTTAGFRDVLELQRQERGNIWDLYIRKIEPLVPRHLRFEVNERIGANGRVVESLDETGIRALADTLRDAGVEAVAVSFINAYANPDHEERAAAILAGLLPSCYVVRSSAIAPHFREYERTSTTTISGYVGPKVSHYLDRFAGRFADKGFDGGIYVMGSNGGVLPLAMTGAYAATTCLSGPAGGVLATQHLARQKGVNNLISFDMGGTSTDVCVIAGQDAVISTRFHIDGLPITLPMFAIETVSAGGGSIATLDDGGMLKVGPQSAGAQPGPACYGRGGERPTVTDALCALGLLRDGLFFGGEIRLDADAARQAFEPVAKAMEVSPENVAAMTLKLANVKMANAVRLVTVREGHDPRDFSLVAFGGAGPLHACSVADEIGIDHVIVPRFPGAFSALGLLSANLRRDYLRAWPVRLTDISDDALRDELAALRRSAETEMTALAAGRTIDWMCHADVRYVGQASELLVPIALPDSTTLADLAEGFHALHLAKFGYDDPDAGIELMNVRVTGFAVVAVPSMPVMMQGAWAPPVVEHTRMPGAERCLFADRDGLGANGELAGPAIVTEPTATSFVPPGWRLEVDAWGHLDLRRIDQN
ncbi:hydantoinase/oxoprolinase family protein [Mesorhizobium sp. INR15]|uniref:hydantoinase/oxoprolinase family protein n=1 Tax=Mesorhizobium sp. INR15 TaxID=2654248 RepID=UPI001896418E|nr:hydantoinase/oxoprolinase family protein [Mesorhizobium sp. INR15]QPC95479.1 hydantoinase/oxoprolinase family protein [Mesorhizobium sp. INR15]